MTRLSKGIALEAILGLLVCGVAFAQQKTFWETYFPIAELFDNPVFFGCVMGSAVLFLAAAYGYLLYANQVEKNAKAWGAKKKPDELVELLCSPALEESRKAFIYLRGNGEPKAVNLVIQKIEEQRKSQSVQPELLFLLEDWQATEAAPMLEAMAKGKSKMAEMAQNTLRHLNLEAE